MGLSIKGYVLEPPRVGSSNSAFTYTPNVYISDQGAFDAAYPSDESVPRTEYHVFVLNDFVPPGTGPGVSRSFVDATFAWTKNEAIQRFDYEGRDGRFKTYPGDAPEQAGNLSAASNTTRLKVTAPLTTDTANYPIRVSVGSGSGTTFPATIVLNDGAFTTPSVGTVQISSATGNLNWNPADLTSFGGQAVRFQRQTFYTFDESTGSLGLIDEVLLLSPLPASGQHPLIRVGFGEYLTPVQRATEGAFSSNPTAGTVEWALTTGRLKFNTGDVAANVGRTIYYDGSTFGFGLTIKTTSVGTLTAPGLLSPLPPVESDLFFRVVNTVQFAQVQYVATLTSPGKKGIVQVRLSDGQVQFSSADQTLYGAVAAQAVVADIDIERGMTLRMFRSPVNLDDSDPTLKDVSAFYTTLDGILADPIIAFPSVNLPAVPVDTRQLIVEVTQGTGTFTGILPRLDVASPPTGLGYVIDFETRELLYAQRKALQVYTQAAPYGAVQLPDPLVFRSGLTLELETAPGSGVYAPLTLGEDALIDYSSGTVTTVQTSGELVAEGTTGSFSGTTFTDTSANFTGSGVQPGDALIVLSGAAKGVYTVDTRLTTTLTTDVAGTTSSNLAYEIRRGAEILVDRFLYEVPPVDPNTRVERLRSLGTISNSPRLTIPAAQAAMSRFRYGKATFSTSTILVANDGSFTSPSSLPQGVVQVSQTTGHLNFSQVDVTAGGLVYWSRTLMLGTEYTVQAPLGFVQLSERLLEKEEVQVRYKNSNGDLVNERAAFLVRKELTADHPTPVSTLTFNPLGREVAADPSPRAYRGGRPQSSDQVQFDVGASTVTFIGAPTVTDALPSGPIVGPSENVYVDYNVYEAIGGEQSFTVLQPPMQGVVIVINAGDSSFMMAGDRTSTFAANILLLVDNSETYLIASSSYSSGDDITTINLGLGNTFRSDFQNPVLAVSSGKIRVTGTVAAPSYFVPEVGVYAAIPKGSPKFTISGDLSRTYVSGTVVLFDNTDLNIVSGSSYDKDAGTTEVVMIANGARQYSGVSLKRSIRPVLPSPSATATTQRSPELGQPFLVYRRTEGQSGTLLTQPDDYTIDASGSVKLVDPLGLGEEVGIFYTGDYIVAAGRSFRASYTFGIVPSEQNGLLNQILKSTYTTYIPDSFYWRVETFTNFRGELAQSYEDDAKASVPTGGPVLENSSSPRLSEQGRESVFFQEGYLANEDLVARPTLKYYNDAINSLEDALTLMDGRVVGDHDGKFLFDGLIDNPPRTVWQDVTNQIDDRFKISPAPYTVTGPPFVTVSVGTYREVYKASATSRFYPTRKQRFGATVNPSGLSTGDAIMDTGVTNLTSISNVQRRFPWAVTTAYALAGSTQLTVDDANGAEELLRPAFANGMKVAIVAQDGTVLVADGSSLTLSGVTATTLTLGAVPVNIPVGSTVRLATNDTSYLKQYRLGVDLGYDLEKGLLTYIDPAGSLLAWAGLTQTPSPPGVGEALDVTVTFPNTETAPLRFPALDGGTLDDDSNRQFPILTPAAISESSPAGFLSVEQGIIATGTGTLRLATSPSFSSTGNLDGSGTVITNTGGAWPSPIPKVHDLVQIRTGLNASSSFRRVTAVGGTTITVNSAYTVDTGFTFAVTTCTSLRVGTTTASSSSTIINDTSANFNIAGVKPGHTAVMTSGGNIGLRRQVEKVLSATSLQVQAFPATTLGATYRIDNPFQTFGATGDSIANQYYSVLTGEYSALNNTAYNIDQFFNTAFVDLATGTNGVANASTFTSAGQTFLADEVNTSHLLFIRNGADAGFYKIQSVDSETGLTVEGTFPSNLTGVTFRIVSSIGLTQDPLNGVLDVALNSTAFATPTFAFYALISNGATVVGDAGAWVMRALTADLNTREAAIATRLTQIDTDITSIEGELSAGDRLYDKRFVWIDARINLETGVLVEKERAIANRIKAQAQVLKQLTKLLSVQQA